jgi:protein arginine N-methyltransferase 1
MRIEYHRTLVADRVRMDAFRAALASVIVKGQTDVVDVGTGSGVLAFMASRLGARKVYALERAEISVVAAKIAKANRLRNVEVIPAHSTELLEPPRVDVVVSETLGNYALEENIIEVMNDASARYLKPGGTLIPSRIEQSLCPVVSPRVHDELTTWDKIADDLDFSVARVMSLNNAYVRLFKPPELLEGGRAAVVWDRIDLSKRNRLARRGEVEWPISKPATVYGLAVWWNAELAPGISLSTSPLSAPTHWEQLYLPSVAPITLQAGETLVATINTRSSEEGGTEIAWTLTARDANGRRRVRHAMSLEQGFLP